MYDNIWFNADETDWSDGAPNVKEVDKSDNADASDKTYEALHRLEYTSDPKETISQVYYSNKLELKLSFVYYIFIS